MAKQTFTTGQVLTAAQMTSLQETAMTGGPASTKTVSYVLVAADAGTRVAMNAAGSTTITVNTALFSAGDTVSIQNIGAGVCTVTAGTATVNTSGSLVLAQYQGGILYFTSASTAIFFQFATPAAGVGKLLQVVSMSKTSVFSSTATSYTDITGYSLSITPSAATSKILVLFSPSLFVGDIATQLYQGFRILRDATTILTNDRANVQGAAALGGGYTWQYIQASFIYLDSPSTTSSVTYKAQTKEDNGIPHGINISSAGNSTITLMEIGA